MSAFLSNTDLVQNGDPNVDKGATGSWDANNGVIVHVGSPVNDTEAANKQYVDDEITTAIAALDPTLDPSIEFIALRTTNFTFLGLPPDTFQNIGVDAPVVGPNAQIDATGLVTFNTQGTYQVFHDLVVGRANMIAVARLFGIFTRSGGFLPANNEATDTFLIAELTNNVNYSSFKANFTRTFSSTETHRLQAYTDSGGNDNIRFYAAPNTKLGTNAFSYRVIVKKIDISN